MSEYSEIIDRIRQKVAKNRNLHCTPTYEPHKWKTHFKPIYTNCYAYALNLDIADPKTEVFIPGRISNKNSNLSVFTTLELYDGIKKDLRFLGIKYREDNGSPLKEGEYRMAIYYASILGLEIAFHFARQDSDGSWSEKNGWTGKVGKLKKYHNNTPPSYLDCGFSLLCVLILKIF